MRSRFRYFWRTVHFGWEGGAAVPGAGLRPSRRFRWLVTIVDMRGLRGVFYAGETRCRSQEKLGAGKLPATSRTTHKLCLIITLFRSQARRKRAVVCGQFRM